MGVKMVEGRLLTASCTTGWGDWVHGELWLFPNGLLRVRGSLRETIAHSNQRTVPDEPVLASFEETDVERLRREHKTNLWISANEIVEAHFRTGLASARVSLTLAGGRKIKLLWLRADPAVAPLKEALAFWGVAPFAAGA
jgi:hypothetical protein